MISFKIKYYLFKIGTQKGHKFIELIFKFLLGIISIEMNIIEILTVWFLVNFGVYWLVLVSLLAL